jgi:hypothetical protein
MNTNDLLIEKRIAEVAITEVMDRFYARTNLRICKIRVVSFDFGGIASDGIHRAAPIYGAHCTVEL